MPYGIIKVDTITFTDAGVDKSVSISGLVQNPTFTGNVTATGTISGLIVQAPTVTGTTANFASGVYTTQISGAIVKVPAGSAGAPSIQVGVGASVAPGLYGAGTDLLGISTGGAGRIFIDSTGRLGLGTSSPAQVLDVAGNGRFFVNAGSPTVSVNNGTIDHYIGVNATGGLVGTSNSYPVLFLTNNTERLRIDSSGRVGIGTSSPGAIFDVDTGNNSTIALFNSTAANGGGISLRASGTTRATLGLGANFITGASLNDVSLTSAGAVLFGNTSGIERLRIDSSGNVGINNTSPGTMLDVGDPGTGLRFLNGAGGNLNIGLLGGTSSVDSYIYQRANGPLIFGTNNTERVRIDSSGNVGIGTSSPATALDVSFTGGMLRAGGASGNSLIQAYTGSTGLGMWAGGITRFYSVGNITLSTNATIGTGTPTGYVDAMTIDSSGRVGIGTSAPEQILTIVNNSTSVATGSTLSVVGGTTNTAGEGGSIAFSNFVKTGVTSAARIRSGLVNALTQEIGYLVFDTNGGSGLTERLRIDYAGNVGIGTSSPGSQGGQKLTVSDGFIAVSTNFSSATSGELRFIGRPDGINYNWAGIRTISDVNMNQGVLAFFTSATNTSGESSTERLRIDSIGNVGIGTSSPGARLQVNSPGGSRAYTSSVLDFSNIHLEGVTPSATTSALTFSSASGGGAAVAFSRDNAYGTFIGFWTNSAASANAATERLRIDPSGNVGIGTSSPGELLHLSANTDPKIQFTDVGNVISKIGISASTALTFEHNGSERLRIDSSGNVGIGTNSPSAAAGVTLARTGTVNIAYEAVVDTVASLAFGYNNSGATNAWGAATGTGFFGTPQAVPITFTTTGAERLRIDSSGRVLVGTSTSIQNLLQGALQIVGTSEDSYITATRYSSGADAPAGIVLGRSKSAIKGTNTIVANGDTLGGISFSGANGTGFDQAANIVAFVDGTPGASGDMPGRLVFSTTADGASSPTERMRIDSAGQTSMTNPVTPVLRIENSNNVSGDGAGDFILRSNCGNTSSYHIRGNTNTVGNWYLYGNGTTSYSSDQRLKKNIETTRDGYLSDVMQLRVVKYNWKDQEDSAPRELGLIAQEVERVFPGLVQDDLSPLSDEDLTLYKQLKASVLPVILLKALQEAVEKIETLEAKVAALEGN